MHLQLERTTHVSESVRSRQLRTGFDVPFTDSQTLTWDVELPLDENDDWLIGMIVGPSGCGKSTILGEGFGTPQEFDWDGAGVVDDFPSDMPVNDIIAACSAVGFNTIPAWLRPYDVLSNGEKFRVDVARRMLDTPEDQIILIDEFTSVVDRQVARITAHAVAKWCRKNGRRLVVATCHFDVEDWLQPDWVLQPAPAHEDGGVEDATTFTWRSVQPRPHVHTSLHAARWSAWPLFAPYHYLTANLNRSARCYVLQASLDGDTFTPACFGGVLPRPNPQSKVTVYGLSRLVTLPDWQGLGLAFVMTDQIAAAFTRMGHPFSTYPAHPALIHAFDRSPNWQLMNKPRIQSTPKTWALSGSWKAGTRPNAVFRYCGPTDDMDDEQAIAITTAGKAKPPPHPDRP